MIDISLLPVADSFGPIPVPHRRVEVAPGRVEAIGPAFSPSQVPTWPGRAEWVWLGEQQPDATPPIAALFRQHINLPSAPQQVRAWMSADTAYRLYINGRLVDRGPDDIGRDHDGTQTGKWFLNFRDLTPFFQAGENLIAFEVFSARAMPQSYASRGQGGLLFEAEIQGAAGETSVFTSDTSWRGIVAPQWKVETLPVNSVYESSSALCFDATLEPQGWQHLNFEDGAWPYCDLVPANEWAPLVTSEIPPCAEALYLPEGIVRASEGVVVPEEIFTADQPLVIREDGSFALRYDRVLSGIIGFRIRGGAGAMLEIQPNELNQLGFHRRAMVRLRDGEQIVEFPHYDSFSVINVLAHNVTEPVEISNVSAHFISYPVEYRGSFSCSDPHLNRMWEISRWLTQICLQTLHLDSPHHQEPIGDPGDYLIESLNTYYAFGSPWLARQDLRKYAWLLRQCDFKPFHISYALLWVQWLLDYADYTGDFELVHELAPEVHELLDTFTGFRGENGLVCNPPNFMFMDWVKIGEFEGHHPPAVIGQGYLTAFYYRALADARRVAELMGDKARAERYTALRQSTKQAYLHELWDEDAGLFRDGKPFQSTVEPSQWLPADKEVETHTAQNNTLAVLYDLVPKVRQVEVMQRIMNGPDFNCQPYFMHFVFDALNHCGLFEVEALAQMRRWNIIEETQSFPEMWDSGDYSHAWQCTPLYQLSARVLGVTPLEPGFAKVSIAPQPCGLDFAKGEVPTPHGMVKVEWQRENGALKISVEAPARVEVVITPWCPKQT